MEVLASRLEHIAAAENMSCQTGVIEQVISASQGDLRKAITLLQSASHLKGSEEVTSQDILEIAGVSPTPSQLHDIQCCILVGGATPPGGITVLSLLHRLL